MLNQNSKVSISDKNSTNFSGLPLICASPDASLSASFASPKITSSNAVRLSVRVASASGVLLAFGVVQDAILDNQQVLFVNVGEVGI